MCADSLASGCLFSEHFSSETESCRLLVPETVIWEAWCFHFGTLGSYFAILGDPGRHWEQQGGHVGIQGRISVDFGMIWDPILRAFRAPMARNLVLFLGSIPCRFRHRFLGRNPGTLRFPKRGFRMERIAKTSFSQKLEISRFED